MKRKRTKAQIEADKRRTGRPRKASTDKHDRRITVYLTSAEWMAMEKMAKDEGISLAELVMKPWREKGV